MNPKIFPESENPSEGLNPFSHAIIQGLGLTYEETIAEAIAKSNEEQGTSYTYTKTLNASSPIHSIGLESQAMTVLITSDKVLLTGEGIHNNGLTYSSVSDFDDRANRFFEHMRLLAQPTIYSQDSFMH